MLAQGLYDNINIDERGVCRRVDVGHARAGGVAGQISSEYAAPPGEYNN